MTQTASESLQHHVLILDRDTTLNRTLLEAFARRGIRGTVAATHENAVRYLDKGPWSLVILSLTFPQDPDGAAAMQILQRIRADEPEMPVLLTGDAHSANTAVAALQKGARQFLARPLSTETVEQLIETWLPTHRTSTLAVLPAGNRTRRFIGSSDEVRRLIQLAQRVAPTSAPVLINGESGTGKELIAQFIHAHSRRAAGPFIRVNCAALTESLLESELFGHEKGAFTGAFARHHGRFEQAHGGTLLLDEITETPPAFQAKLLRVLEEMNFHRVGGAREIAVNVRIISTTNTDIVEEVARGRFRADLYYRLAAIRLCMPPLRSRIEDIPQMIWCFVNEFAPETGRRITAVDTDMLDLFARCNWPGNVRQLRNVVRTCLILGSGEVLSLDAVPWLREELAPPAAEPAPDAFDLAGMPLQELERRAILATLEQARGNQTKAAKVLGISGRTLRDKMKRYRDADPLFSAENRARVCG